jgi:hypothetical protein
LGYSPAPKVDRAYFLGMGIKKPLAWQCLHCGAAGSVSAEQPLWSIECDDCGDGEVSWVYEDLETRGFSFRTDRDSPLDAPSAVSF